MFAQQCSRSLLWDREKSRGDVEEELIAAGGQLYQEKRTANSRDTIPIRPTSNQVLCLEFQEQHKLLTDNMRGSGCFLISPSPESSPVKGEDSYPSVSQFKTFFITPVQLSRLQCRFDFRMAFDFAGEGRSGTRQAVSSFNDVRSRIFSIVLVLKTRPLQARGAH